MFVSMQNSICAERLDKEKAYHEKDERRDLRGLCCREWLCLQQCYMNGEKDFWHPKCSEQKLMQDVVFGCAPFSIDAL